MPGSFDPFTLGHWDILTRACALFDHVIVGIGTNNSKRAMYAADQRLDMVRATIAGLSNVDVAIMDGLLVDFCTSQGATVVVRGARGGADFEAEWALATMNASLGHVETVVLPASPAVGFISSTLVRSVAAAGGDVSTYVPTSVSVFLKKEL
jgi:pantetheine-phosphate adenylyltransferase